MFTKTSRSRLVSALVALLALVTITAARDAEMTLYQLAKKSLPSFSGISQEADIIACGGIL